MSDEIDAYRQPKPRFDPTINYGHILTAVSFIVAGAGAYYGMRAELQNVDQRVENREHLAVTRERGRARRRATRDDLT